MYERKQGTGGRAGIGTIVFGVGLGPHVRPRVPLGGYLVFTPSQRHKSWICG